MGFDSSTETCSLSSLRKEDSSPISKIDFECSFLPQEHAQLWFDEEQKVLCTGFPGPSAHQPLNVDEVRVHPCGSDTNYESIQRPSLAKDPSELGKRINIHSGDIVTLLTGKDSVTFRLYYRTGDESYKETWSNIGAKTESLNSQIDRLLQLESPSEPSKELEEPRQQGSPLKTLLVFLLPAIIFTLLFVLFGETNRKLVTF